MGNGDFLVGFDTGAWSGNLVLPDGITADSVITIVARRISGSTLNEFELMSGTMSDFLNGTWHSIENSGLDFADFSLGETAQGFELFVWMDEPIVLVVTSDSGFIGRLFMCNAADVAAASSVRLPICIANDFGDFYPPMVNGDSLDMAFFMYDSQAEHFRFLCFNPSAEDLVLSSDSAEPAHVDVQGGAFGLDIQCASNTTVEYLWQTTNWLSTHFF